MPRRLVTFAAVGVANTAVYYGCYLALVLVLPYLVAHVCAFGVATVGSYFLNCRYTFRTSPRWGTFALFPVSSLVNLVVSTAGLRLFVGTLGVSERVAPLLAGAVALPITYVVAHRVIVGRRTSSGVAV